VHPPKGPKRDSFSAFRSAAEEAEMKTAKQADNEGGHMSSSEGRVVHDPNAPLPYVAVLNHPGSDATEHCFATMREAEAFVKAKTPLSRAALSSLYDRSASDS
jgi:hypothetical protein